MTNNSTERLFSRLKDLDHADALYLQRQRELQESESASIDRLTSDINNVSVELAARLLQKGIAPQDIHYVNEESERVVGVLGPRNKFKDIRKKYNLGRGWVISSAEIVKADAYDNGHAGHRYYITEQGAPCYVSFSRWFVHGKTIQLLGARQLAEHSYNKITHSVHVNTTPIEKADLALDEFLKDLIPLASKVI